jgi:isopenicillin-N N-acyltransferase-like protein
VRLSGRLAAPLALVVIALWWWLPRFEGISTEHVSLDPARRCGQGELEERDGLQILHLRGGPYEIGYQHGVLLREKIRSRIRDEVLETLLHNTDVSHLLLLRYARQLDGRLPADYRSELRGLADGAGLSYSDVLLLNCYHELISAPIRPTGIRKLFWSLYPPFVPHYGSTMVLPGPADSSLSPSDQETLHQELGGAFAAFGGVTQDGRLLHGAHLSLPGPDLNEILIIVYEPDVGNRALVVGRPGVVGATIGLNEEQISIVGLASPSQDTSLEGLPLPFLLREALRHAGDIDTSLSIIASATCTSGHNVLIADGKPADARAVELSGHRHAVFEADNDLVVRTNHYLDPGLLETQHFSSELTLEGSRQRFDAVSRALYSDYGRLDVPSAIALLASQRVAEVESYGLEDREPVIGFLMAPSELELQVLFYGDGKTRTLGVRLDEGP